MDNQDQLSLGDRNSTPRASPAIHTGQEDSQHDASVHSGTTDPLPLVSPGSQNIIQPPLGVAATSGYSSGSEQLPAQVHPSLLTSPGSMQFHTSSISQAEHAFPPTSTGPGAPWTSYLHYRAWIASLEEPDMRIDATSTTFECPAAIVPFLCMRSPRSSQDIPWADPVCTLPVLVGMKPHIWEHYPDGRWCEVTSLLLPLLPIPAHDAGERADAPVAAVRFTF
jgi:hypothetical protein